MTSNATETGWTALAETEGAVELVGALAALDDTDGSFTRSELADLAGVPVKTLYLDGTVETCVDLGLLARIEDDGGEPRYRVDPESDVLRAAERFDAAVRAAGEGDQPERGDRTPA
jgi:hypothetical protein